MKVGAGRTNASATPIQFEPLLFHRDTGQCGQALLQAEEGVIYGATHGEGGASSELEHVVGELIRDASGDLEIIIIELYLKLVGDVILCILVQLLICLLLSAQA